MKVLIIGNGGREHALGWKIKQDQPDTLLYFYPGNAGTAQIGTNVSELSDINSLLHFAKNQAVDLTVVGPEAYLVEGIVDDFQAHGLKIYGPDKKSALLEGSKAFAKDFMKKYGVKTAQYERFTNFIAAKEYVKTQKFPLVVKASGLAAGKGVIICNDLPEAEKAIEEMMYDKVFGEAGSEIVIEEFLEGFEASILSIFNGKEIIPFISAKDHKKIGEGETGLNTGGMGVIAPNPLFTEQHKEEFIQDILLPTLKGLQQEKLLFSGTIFFGLMINSSGVYLLEYNLRFGDPETQAVLPLMESNFLSVLEKAVAGENFSLQWKPEHSVCVVMASGGYPLNFEKGYVIRNLEALTSLYFIAGAQEKGNEIVTSGGRVLNIVGVGETLAQAREITYENVKKVHYDYEYYRKDIGEI